MSDCDTWAEKIAFGAIVDCFESLANSKQSKEIRVQKLRRFLGHVQTSLDQVTSSQDTSLFPVLRLFLPQLDRERGSYGIKQTLFTRLFIDLLKIGQNSVDATKLKEYKAPSGHGGAQVYTDYASVLFAVIKDRGYQRTNISVYEINKSLDKIVSLNAQKKAVNEILLVIFKKMDPTMIKWLVRIVLGEVKFGLGQKSILKAFHMDADELYDSNANLRKVCQVLRNPGQRLNEIEISLGTAFRPMLAENAEVGRIEAIMNNQPFYIEVKYDGERMLAHRFPNSTFRFYSRNCFDFTSDFGSDASQGKFAYYIEKALSAQVSSVILDGEICPYNKKTQTLSQKSEKMNIRQLSDQDDTYQQCLVVYDMVYLNGKVLTNLPLKERVEMLDKVIRTEIQGRICLGERILASTKAEVVEALNNAIDACEEGIMIKDPHSVYKPGSKKKYDWLKVKPEYCSSMSDTCDLVILGGYYYSGGKRHPKGTVTHFLCGVKDGSTYRSFTRVSSGVSQKELYELVEKLAMKKTLKDLSCSVRYGKEKPDVYIDPAKSKVLEVRAAEIIRSDSYDVGNTLRFPRIVRVREDKSVSDCMTYAQLRSYLNSSSSEGKLAKRHYNDDEQKSPTRKRRKAAATIRAVKVDSIYQPLDNLEEIEPTSKFLEDKVIVVEPKDPQLKAKLERIIVSHGGIVEQNTKEGITWAYIQTADTKRARNQVSSGHCNVIKHKWLEDCANGKFRALLPSDMVFSTQETTESLNKVYDQFGDSYGARSSKSSLEHSMQQVAMQKLSSDPPTATVMAEFQEEFSDIFAGYVPGLFRPVKASFHPDGCDLVEKSFRFYGGQLVQENYSVYVVPNEIQSCDLKAIKERRRKSSKRPFKIVTAEWIDHCLKEGHLVSEAEFLM